MVIQALKIGLSPSENICVVRFIEITLKNDEECFLFHLKSFSLDI